MNIENALPQAIEAEASVQPTAEQLATQKLNAEIDGDESENRETESESGEEKKEERPPKTPEQREIDRLRRGLERKTRQREEARAAQRLLEAELQAARERLGLTDKSIGNTNQSEQSNSEKLSFTQAELSALIAQEAKKLAPTISERQQEEAKRFVVATELAKEWGQEKFTELTDDLAEVFDPEKQLAILEMDKPRELIEYLTDPDNAEEAKAIARMSAFKAGRAIDAIERKLSAARAQAKPQPSSAKPPIEPIRGQGGSVTRKPLAALEGDEFNKRRREMIARRH